MAAAPVMVVPVMEVPVTEVPVMVDKQRLTSLVAVTSHTDMAEVNLPDLVTIFLVMVEVHTVAQNTLDPQVAVIPVVVDMITQDIPVD